MTKWSNQSNLKMETPFNEYTLINEIINSHSVFVYLFHVEQKKTLWTIGEINKIIGFNPFNGSANTCEIDEQHYHPDDRNIIKSRMAFFYQTLHNKWAGVFRVKHVNGKWVWIYSQMTTLEKDNQGLPIVVSGFYINARDGLQTPIQMKDLLREFLAEDNHDKIKKLSKSVKEKQPLLNLLHRDFHTPKLPLNFPYSPTRLTVTGKIS